MAEITRKKMNAKMNDPESFVPPPSSDALINFVNELGYPKLVRNLSNVVTNDMFQPWRALTTIINLCLTGKTFGFERPRDPVLEILWGVITRAHIDYAERIWEELTQSIHTFIEDKQNLSWHTTGKEKATLIMILSIQFTKLIIHHLQRRHKFYPRPDSPLYLPNEEHVLGYLKFSAKGTKREVFGMLILGSLIAADIQEASYYQEYLANVAKHRWYLAGETWSNLDSPAPKPTKPARNPKSTAPKAPPRPSVSTPVTSAQPAPTSAPAKPQENKRKQATETSDKPSKAKKSKYGFVGKKRSLKSVAALVAKDAPAKEPQELESGKYQPLPKVPRKGKAKVTEEQVAHDLLSLQKRKKKSPADQYIFQRRTSTPTGSSRHDEPLYAELEQFESEESKKVVSGADEGGQGEGEGQAGSDPGAQVEGQTGSDAGAQYEGQARSNPDENSKGQAGPDPGNAGADVQSIPSHVVQAGSNREHMDLDAADVSLQPSTEQLDEGFTATAYPKVQENLRLTVKEQVLLEDPASSSGTLSSLQHLSKYISFGNLFFSDKPSDADNDKATTETEVESMVSVTIQQDMSLIPPMTSPIIDLTLRPESPKVHQQFKATTTTITTILLPPPAQQQSTTETMMMKRIDIPHQVSKAVSKGVTEAVEWAMQAPLRNRFRDLPEADMKEILHQRMWETESYKSHKDHMQLYKALEKSMNRDHSQELAQDLLEARKKKKKSRESPKTPPGSPPHQPPPPPPPARPSEASGAPGASGSSKVPPPPPPPSSTNQESQSKGSAAPSSSRTAASAEYQAWTTTDIRLRPSISLTPTNLEMDEDMGPDKQAQSLDDEDIGSAYITKVNLRQDWWKPLEEERPATPEPSWSIPSSDAPVPTNNWASALASDYSPPPEDSLLAQTGDIATFMDWFCKRRGITELKPQDLEGPAFEIVKVFHPDVIHLHCQMEECHKLLTDSVDDPLLRHNISKPLPLGGLLGQVTIQSDFFFNKDLEYLRYGSKGSRHALSISKMKAAYYSDVGLEQMVPDQFWIDEECKYDIAVIAVRTHMRILSVVRIEVFSMYGYDYMKKIVLRRSDLSEHVIVERDFKYLYLSDFEDLYLLNLQGHLNHLPPKDKKILITAINQWTRHLVIRQRVEDFQLGIESYQTQLNLTKPQWDATGFEYKHDYIVIDSPRAVMFQDKYGVQIMMRFNEIHKFSDGTLQQIDEALDYRQGVHVRHSEAIEDKEDLQQPGELCWWTRQRRRLQTSEAYRMIKSFWHSRTLSDDL
nr:monodehydroascorbate reductase [Tanacetum cinerariifolium]